MSLGQNLAHWWEDEMQRDFTDLEYTLIGAFLAAISLMLLATLAWAMFR